MQPGPIVPLAYYRLPGWVDAPHDVFDYRTGIRLGANWAGLRFHDGKLSRWARDGAEVLINPAGANERTLSFILDPARTPQPCTLQALDDADRVVASTPAGAGLVHLTVPLKSDGVHRLRLRLVTSAADGPHHFRILRAGDVVPPHPKYAGVARKVRALCGPDVGLTGSWHALEIHGATSFRWVDNDAGLVATTLGRPATLLVDIEPGPSLGGKPGELTVRDKNGSVLVQQVLAKAERLRIPLPAVPGASAEVRLFIEGGRLPIPRDPRVLNFRVLRAELSDDN
jgi:hypothetical protein